MSNWLKTVPKKLTKKPSATRRMVMSEHFVGQYRPDMGDSWKQKRKNFAQHQNGSLQWRSDTHRQANTVVEAESLVPICKLYEDVTPLLYQISQKWSEMISYSKGANKFSVVWKRTVLGRLRSPLPGSTMVNRKDRVVVEQVSVKKL